MTNRHNLRVVESEFQRTRTMPNERRRGPSWTREDSDRVLPTVREAIFLAAEPFIDGLTVPPRKDRITRSLLIGAVEDVVTAANGLFTTVTFVLDAGGPNLELYELGRGEKAKTVDITFV